MKKKVMLFVLFVAIIFSLATVSALGVSPAKKEYNFKPGLEDAISYRVFESNPDMELELYVKGNLAEYVTLDKNFLTGGGIFSAHLKLPDNIEAPGRNRILIGVKQKVDPELIQGAIGTAITIQVVIDVYVPYPGRYLEIDLHGHDANIGEPVQFELNVQSRGEEDISVVPKIEIYSSEKKVETLLFKPRTIKSQEYVGLKKILNTSDYNPGNYKAKAIIDYGALAEDEIDFRIGSLFINLVNYSSVFPIGKLSPFEIEIESGWNNMIDGAYANIDILNGSKVLDSFKTTTTNLVPWEKKKIVGHFDTSNYTEGAYDANITLFYFGKEKGESNSELVQIFFVKQASLVIWYSIGGAGMLLIIILVLIKIFSRHKGKTKNEKTKRGKK